MAFEVYTNTQQSSSDKVQVDWKALNEYVVETAGLQQEEVLIGVVSGLIDVGIQKQEDAKVPFTGSEEDEAAEIAASPATYFETLFDYESKKDVRYKRWPQKDQQSIVLVVDFPEIMLDKSTFFGGESNPQPLRMILGGEFIPFKGADKVAAKPFALSVRKNDKTNNQWSMAHNSTLYQMAVAAKIVNKGDPFLPQDVDKLVGKAFQFKALVGFNDKGYFTEKCSFAAGLGRSQVAPEYADSILHMIQFNKENKEEDLRQLRASLKNTMKKATNYEGSKVKAQLEALFGPTNSAPQNSTEQSQEAPKEVAKPTPQAKPKAASKVVVEREVHNAPPVDMDDDIPFIGYMVGKKSYVV